MGQAFQLAQADSLAGNFTLIQVTTNDSGIPTLNRRIHLYVNDSTRRYAFVKPHVGTRPGERPLAGWVVSLTGEPSWDRIVGSRDPNGPGIEWVHDRIVIGAVDGLDSPKEELWVQRWSPSGFSGTWREEPGIVRTMDSAGRIIPPPEGYFCAYRTPS